MGKWGNVIICGLSGHKLRRVRDLAIGGYLTRCQRCGIELCIHDGRQQVIPFDEDVQKVERDIQRAIDRFTAPPESAGGNKGGGA